MVNDARVLVLVWDGALPTALLIRVGEDTGVIIYSTTKEEKASDESDLPSPVPFHGARARASNPNSHAVRVIRIFAICKRRDGGLSAELTPFTTGAPRLAWVPYLLKPVEACPPPSRVLVERIHGEEGTYSSRNRRYTPSRRRGGKRVALYAGGRA